MKIKKNWSQAKGPSRPWLQAPSTQRTEVPAENPDTSPEPSLTNYQDNIEVLPQLSHDNSSEDEYESDDQDSESDDSLANKLAEQILHKKLKESGINIPNNPVAKEDSSPNPLMETGQAKV